VPQSVQLVELALEGKGSTPSRSNRAYGVHVFADIRRRSGARGSGGGKPSRVRTSTTEEGDDSTTRGISSGTSDVTGIDYTRRSRVVQSPVVATAANRSIFGNGGVGCIQYDAVRACALRQGDVVIADLILDDIARSRRLRIRIQDRIGSRYGRPRSRKNTRPLDQAQIACV
jgi:hypothetical protein